MIIWSSENRFMEKNMIPLMMYIIWYRDNIGLEVLKLMIIYKMRLILVNLLKKILTKIEKFSKLT